MVRAMSATARQTDLVAAAQRFANRRTAPERRRFRRFEIVVGGRMLDPLGREHDCRTLDLSPGDMRLAAPIAVDVGQRVVVYLEHFGRVAGAVARRGGDDDFAVIFDASVHKREKLAEQLTWRVNQERLGLSADDATLKPRWNGDVNPTRIELENGDVIEGQILDFSLAGVTVRALRMPPLGAWVRVSGTYGRVSRAIEGGFAVDFESRLAPPSE